MQVSTSTSLGAYICYVFFTYTFIMSKQTLNYIFISSILFPSQVVNMMPLLVGTGTTITMETKYEWLKNSFTRNIMNGTRTTTSWF